MGGFLYKLDRKDPDAEGGIAFPYYHPLKTLILRKRIILTKADIEDRSKGDLISKGLVLLQTSWFVIQIFARIGQRLPITELELVTLAYAVLNFAIYFFWWNKPQNISCPVRIYAHELGDLPEIKSEASAAPTPCILDGSPSSNLELSPLNIEKQVEDSSDILQPPKLVTIKEELMPFSSEVGLLSSFTGIVAALLAGDDVYENVFEAPLIFTHCGRLSTKGRFHAFALASGVATVFGAMHAAAWSFNFPSSAERVVWRTLAVLLIVVPVYSFLLSSHFYWKGIATLSTTITRHGLKSLRAIAYVWVPVCLMVVYIVSRLVLLVLMFVFLRKVPPGIYETVSWTNYIPHF